MKLITKSFIIIKFGCFEKKEKEKQKRKLNSWFCNAVGFATLLNSWSFILFPCFRYSTSGCSKYFHSISLTLLNDKSVFVEKIAARNPLNTLSGIIDPFWHTVLFVKCWPVRLFSQGAGTIVIKIHWTKFYDRRFVCFFFSKFKQNN